MSSNLKSRLQDVLDALRADYPRSAEDVLRQIIDGLPDETSVPQFEYCVFEGPPPAPHESWSAWMDSAPRKGATIRASAPETSARPFAWTIPGDETADMNGFIPARVDQEGEF